MWLVVRRGFRVVCRVVRCLVRRVDYFACLLMDIAMLLCCVVLCCVVLCCVVLCCVVLCCVVLCCVGVVRCAALRCVVLLLLDDNQTKFSIF